MSRRWIHQVIGLMTMIALVIVAAGPLVPQTALAQDGCPEGLSDEDCEILDRSLTAIDNTSSVFIENYSIDLVASSDDDALTFVTEGSGPVVLGEGTQVLAFDITADPASLDTPEEYIEGSGAMRVLPEGIFIANEMDGELVWYRIQPEMEDVEGSVDEATADAELDVEDALAMVEETIAFLPELATSEYVIWSRGENVTVDGEEMAAFTIEVDAASFITSPYVTELVAEALVMLSSEGDMQTEGIDPALMAGFIPILLDLLADEISEDYTFEITTYISLDDYDVTYLSVDFEISLALDFLGDIASQAGMTLPERGIAVDFSFETTLGRHNETFEIEAPEEYEDITDEIGPLLEEQISGFLEESLTFEFGAGSGSAAGTASPEDAEFSVEVGSETGGTLSSSNDTDTYRFSANAGDELRIAVRAEDSTNLDTFVTVYGPSGSLLDENDDAINPPEAYELSFLDSYVSIEAPEDGDYVVVVTSVFPVDSEDYTLIVEAE